MNRNLAPVSFIIICFFYSCTVNKNYNGFKKYPREVLEKDYTLLRTILEEKHPSLYWYTSKDSMDIYFSKYYNAINDSMTEQQFAWHVLAPLVDKIHCGHTSVGMSKGWTKWAQGRRFPSFPLFMKIWNDTMSVIANLDHKDSIFKRGTLVTSVNGISTDALIKRMFDYLPEDGHANNINYIRMSANFPYYHRNIFGLSKKYTVGSVDSNGVARIDTLPVYIAPKDSIIKDSLTRIERKNMPKEKRIAEHRSLKIDTSGKFAVITLNTFSNGRLRSFFRRSFKKMRKEHISSLVLDIRSNGGGRVGLSTLLAKYISRQPFKVADTIFSKARTLGPYSKYIQGRYLNNIQMFFISGKRNDGLFHMRHMEEKLLKPKIRNHYNGEVYVLINGPTFSAASLFCNVIKGQPGITLIGEETGGGWYGNNGIMIPDIILPHTKTRVRLPLYRLVQYKHINVKGSGIVPDIYVPTNYDALLKSYDKKMKVAKELILHKSAIADTGGK
ncbi:MAG: S41 family peptidase [Ferruginibacter sp.]